MCPEGGREGGKEGRREGGKEGRREGGKEGAGSTKEHLKRALYASSSLPFSLWGYKGEEKE